MLRRKRGRDKGGKPYTTGNLFGDMPTSLAEFGAHTKDQRTSILDGSCQKLVVSGYLILMPPF
jgi:hypothetical protein